MHTLFRNAQTRGPWQPLWRPFLLLLLLTLALCGTARAQRGGYQILQATYGTQWQSVDVTGRVQQLAQQGERFQAGNEAFGVDPAPGQRKTLRIQAQGRDGMARTFEYAESQWVDGSPFLGGNAWDQGGWNDGGEGDPVLQATYGTAWQSIDVTDRIRQLARQGGSFQVGNDLFGTDPAPGQRKTLRIQARGRDGRVRTTEYGESQWVDGSRLSAGGGYGDPGGAYGGGQVVQATYGTAWQSIDVTERIRQLARQGGGFQVGNDLFGTDPAPGQRKTLRIQTRGRDGRGRTTEYAESQWVDAGQLATGGGGYGDQGGYGRLVIHSATYGDGYRQVDVTERLRAYVQGGRLDVTVGNDLAGMDPAPNVRKVLRVDYSVGNGRVQQATVYESQGLRLP